MKLTNRSEYALLAMVYLARQKQGQYIGGEEIAAAQNIPLKFLRQILAVLKQTGYVRTCKGQRGGYQLAKKPGRIFIAQIVRLFDGALAPTECVSRFFYESTPLEKEKKMVGVFRKIRNYIAQTLEETTLDDVK